jgi:hypothetical protein
MIAVIFLIQEFATDEASRLSITALWSILKTVSSLHFPESGKCGTPPKLSSFRGVRPLTAILARGSGRSRGFVAAESARLRADNRHASH